MEPESVGKMLPRVLIPYAQQWAERSGMTLLSRLLEDEHFGALVEKYGEELAIRATAPAAPTVMQNHRWNGQQTVPREATVVEANVVEADVNGRHLANLQDRISALEAEHAMQQAMFEQLRIKIRPLAQALGCCPECFIGIFGCGTCGGRSSVGSYRPDYALLEELVIKPLAERGVPLNLAQAKTSARARQSNESTAKEKKLWPKK
jgi:hypothetical protein